MQSLLFKPACSLPKEVTDMSKVFMENIPISGGILPSHVFEGSFAMESQALSKPPAGSLGCVL